MAKYYYLREISTNEILFFRKYDFKSYFGGAYEHMISLFSVDFYVKNGKEIPEESEEIIFLMNFVENWNSYNKAFLNDYEAIYFSDLPKEEQNKILVQQKEIIEKYYTIKPKEDGEITKLFRKSQEEAKIDVDYNSDEKTKKKKAGNGLAEPRYSKALQKWVWQYTDDDGSRQTLTQRKGERKTDFFTRVNKIKNQLNDGTYIKKSYETVISLAEQHIESKHSDKITSDNSYGRDLQTLNQIKNTCSNFCYLPIQKVTLRHIEEAKKEIRKYANSTIDKIWNLLQKAFSMASSPSRKIITFNIMLDETLRKPLSDEKTKKVMPLKDAEFEKLFSILDNQEKEHPYRNIVKMQGISGMRIGEVLARSIDDFDKETGKFDVHNTLTQDENGKVIWSEHTKIYNKKTQIDEGQRYLPLNNKLFANIVSIIEEQTRKRITNIRKLLFWDYKNNSFITPKEVNAWLRRLNNKYHITSDSLNTHRLRHTALTYWRKLGLDLSAIQYFAGHVEGSEITEKVYIDVDFEFAEKQLENIS